MCLTYLRFRHSHGGTGCGSAHKPFFASLLLSSNVPLLYVSQQLGHSKPTVTLKYYARWIPSGQVHRVNVLDESNGNPVLTPATTSYEVAVAGPA